MDHEQGNFFSVFDSPQIGPSILRAKLGGSGSQLFRNPRPSSVRARRPPELLLAVSWVSSSGSTVSPVSVLLLHPLKDIPISISCLSEGFLSSAGRPLRPQRVLVRAPPSPPPPAHSAGALADLQTQLLAGVWSVKLKYAFGSFHETMSKLEAAQS